MKKTIKIAGIVLAALVVIAILLYVIGFGFVKESCIYVMEYNVAEDGSKMEIKFINASSIGFIRKADPHRNGSEVDVDFYRAFGGINGNIGVMEDYVVTVDLDSSIDKICFCRGNKYEVVLYKTDDGNWVKPDSSYFSSESN